jgi:hypothetical protein
MTPDPRRLLGAPRDVQDDFLIKAVRADPRAAFVLDKTREMALPDAWLFSGAIYQNVWNALCGLPPGHGVGDYDVGYFDPDTSWEAEDVVIKRCEPHFADLGAEVEVRNQARVPLWFSKKYGVERRPLVSTPDAISQFAAHAHAVGLRAGESGDEICAPYGLDDLFGLTITVRQPLAAREAFEAKVEWQKRIWPV